MVEPTAPEPAFEPPFDGIGGVDAERLGEDLAAVRELMAAGIEIDGEAQVCETTWVVYGNAGYGGEVVVGEYGDAAEAEAVLRAAHPERAGDADDEEPVL